MLGKDVRDVPSGCLRMHIYEYTCACGNQWTHSEIWGKRTTSNSYFHLAFENELDDEYKYVEAISTQRNVQHCFRCLPLKIKLGEIVTIGQLSLRRPISERAVYQKSTTPNRPKPTLTLEDL